MPKCPKCFTTIAKGQKCWQCGKPTTTATAAAAAATQMPPDWNSVRYDIEVSQGIRKEFAAALGITDKGHPPHGNNFDSLQTKRQIMNDLLAPCRHLPAHVWAEKRQTCIAIYGYDPDA